MGTSSNPSMRLVHPWHLEVDKGNRQLIFETCTLFDKWSPIEPMEIVMDFSSSILDDLIGALESNSVYAGLAQDYWVLYKPTSHCTGKLIFLHQETEKSYEISLHDRMLQKFISLLNKVRD